ncbi:MAG: glutamate-1-semialdehyde 2,1-aminomutase [Gammaproteobacteria bacterium]|jgi:glutamate-1-semialdehyde 2,1-aminomutase|nr:glutamate-1-semialdehyde 2,1-aminomutase [Gammaproteobacteria bacterium]
MTNTKLSKKAFNEAKKVFPGGVNSPVRAFKNVNSLPVFIERGCGAYIYDLDGNKYIDYIGSWGPMILGHANKDVISSIQKSIKKSTSFGAPTLLETKLAKLIQKHFPSMEKMRMTSSGTEATMSAIRLARGCTGKDKIIKFEGCYHGHTDSLLVNAGSGAATFGVPSSPGIPKKLTELTYSLEYNNIEAVENCFKKNGSQIACVIVEPIAGNMNCIIPNNNFIKKLRFMCNKYKSILIFDEVMTGFRVSLGGAQKIYKVKPDITTLGKIVGGGMPIGVFGGKKKYMDKLSPSGPIYHAGTLSGNPIAMSAGIKTIELLSRKNFYNNLENKTKKLVIGLQNAAKKYNINIQVNYSGGMFGFFFTDKKNINNFNDVSNCNKILFEKFFKIMLSKGIYFAPSPFEAGFISSKHTIKDINFTIKSAEEAFKKISI